MITEQGLTVYINDCSSITRAPTLALTYLCLFVRIRTYENLPEACRLIKQYHNVSTPNVRVLEKTLRKHKLFQEKQRQQMDDADGYTRDNYAGTYLKHRQAYRVTEGGMKKENVDEEVEILFNKQTRPPIPFNGTAGVLLHEQIQRTVDANYLQMPIVHVQRNEFLVGCTIQQLELKEDDLKRNEVIVRIGKGHQELADYCEENEEYFYKTYVHHMHQYDQSLEWVCDQIINGKQIKTETGVEQNPKFLRTTQWVSINLEDKSNALKNKKKGHIDGRQRDQKAL